MSIAASQLVERRIRAGPRGQTVIHADSLDYMRTMTSLRRDQRQLATGTAQARPRPTPMSDRSLTTRKAATVASVPGSEARLCSRMSTKSGPWRSWPSR